MKKGIFITNSSMNHVENKYPWQVKHAAILEGRTIDLPAEGLLTFRRKFKCEKEVKRAIIRATALGVFDMEINGERIGNRTENGVVFDELKPEWTDYRLRVFEYEYDITDSIRKENTFISRVGVGWWSGRISFGFYGYKKPAFCCEIELEYADGTSEIIASDEDFETAFCGPVMYADLWEGEYYDATKKDEPETAVYEKPAVYTEFTGEIVPHFGPYVRVRPELERHPLSAVVYDSVKENGTTYGEINVTSRRIGKNCEKMILKAGDTLVLDMGQNMVGRPKFRISAEKGTKIRLGVAEFLNDSGEKDRGNDGAKGSIYIQNYRTALARITYVANGEGVEEYAPKLSFYGFRYIELRAENDIDIDMICGEVIGSDLKMCGSIETSHGEVNKLISNIKWGALGNYLSVPTDCPQRDERLGWTGDTQIFCGAGSYLMDTDMFFRKWLQDARDAQVGFDGRYDEIIPRLWTKERRGSAAWTDAGVIVPYNLYLMYNDTEVIREHYDSMEAYMTGILNNGLLGPDEHYGDWLAYDETDKKVLSYCYHAYDARLMAIFSKVLGKEDRASYYKDLAEQVVAKFNELFVDGDELTERSQCAYLCALHFDMVKGAVRENCIKNLKAKIEENNYTLSTGFVGTGILNQTLSEVGLDNLAYSLLLQTNDPSWLYSVRQGATTIWERWNSYTLAKGFGRVTMNSFNHYAYGAVLEWMYSKMAGISPDPENPGFKHFVLCPRPDTRKDSELPEGQEHITFVKAQYDSACGMIKAEWHFENGEFVFSAEIPEGTSARVEFPLLCEKNALEINGLIMSEAELGAKTENGKMIFELGAGNYIIK